MKSFRNALLIAAAFVLPLAGCAQQQSVMLWNKVLAKAEQLANDSKDFEAIDVAHFLRKNGQPMVVKYGGMAPDGKTAQLFLQSSRWGALQGQQFQVVFITKEDLQRYPMWEVVLKRRDAFGSFTPEMLKTLAMDAEQPYSLTTQALILLHEGYHARTYFAKGDVSKNKVTRMLDEVGAYELTNRIAHAIGGPGYEYALAQSVKYAEAHTTFDQNGDIEAATIPRTYDPRADEWFGGKPLSDHDIVARRNMILIDAGLRLGDKRYTGSKLLAFKVYTVASLTGEKME